MVQFDAPSRRRGIFGKSCKCGKTISFDWAGAFAGVVSLFSMASTPGCGSTDATATTALQNQARSPPPPPCGSSSHAKPVSLLFALCSVLCAFLSFPSLPFFAFLLLLVLLCLLFFSLALFSGPPSSSWRFPLPLRRARGGCLVASKAEGPDPKQRQQRKGDPSNCSRNAAVRWHRARAASS